MSRWKLTLEHVDGDLTHSVSLMDKCEPNDPQELMDIARTFANALAAFEKTDCTVPCHGREVLESFTDTFEREWAFWKGTE